MHRPATNAPAKVPLSPAHRQHVNTEGRDALADMFSPSRFVFFCCLCFFNGMEGSSFCLLKSLFFYGEIVVVCLVLAWAADQTTQGFAYTVVHQTALY